MKNEKEITFCYMKKCKEFLSQDLSVCNISSLFVLC